MNAGLSGFFSGVGKGIKDAHQKQQTMKPQGPIPGTVAFPQAGQGTAPALYPQAAPAAPMIQPEHADMMSRVFHALSMTR